MKTQTFGVLTYRSGSETRVSFAHVVGRRAARANFREKRENGSDKDNPIATFPQDGKFAWTKGEKRSNGYVYGVKESDGNYHYELRYDGGQGDEEWMKEKDRNYLARLEREGTLQEKEPEEYKRIMEPRQEDLGTFRRSPQDKPSRQSKEQNTCVFFKSKTPSAPTFDTMSPEPTSGQLPMTLMNKTLLKLRQLLSKSALLALEKGSRSILEEELLWCLKSKSSEMLKLEGLTDKTDLIASKLANSLTKHCELTPDDRGGKEIVLKNLQDTKVSLFLQNIISNELDNILKELDEQKEQTKEGKNIPTLSGK